MATHGHQSALPPAPRSRMRGNEWRWVAVLLPHLWEFRWRVALALALLTAAKLANVSVPLTMKGIVDGLDPSLAVVAVPVALLAAYGLLRFSTTLFGELRDAVFVRVTQNAIRRGRPPAFRPPPRRSLPFHPPR